MPEPPTLDDRQQPFQVYNPTKGDHWTKEELARDPGRAELSVRLAAMTNQSVPRWARILFVAALTIINMGAVFLGATVIRSYGLPAWIIPTLTTLTCIFIYGAILKRRRAPMVTRALLADRRCAACAYLLDQLAPAPDTCIVCPECGAAWLDARLGTAPPARPAGAVTPRSVILGLRFAPATVMDANGRLHGIAPPSSWKCDEHVRRAVRRATLLRRVLLCTLLLIPLGLCTFTLAASPSFRSLPSLTTSAGWLKLLGLFFAVYWIMLVPVLIVRTWTGRTASLCSVTAKALTRRSLCPACGENLKGSQPDPQHRVQCPTCRAVWPVTPASPTPRTPAPETAP